MISVIIPHHGDAKSLTEVTLPFLAHTPADLFSQIIIVSTAPRQIDLPTALRGRCRLYHGEKGRGCKLHHGAQFAKQEWLFFLHADTDLIGPWQGALLAHIATSSNMPAVFKLSYNARGLPAKIVGGWGGLRSRLFGVAYGDQGLVISRQQYQDLGGYRSDYPLMEDVDIIERIGGKGRFKLLSASTRTSAEKYLTEGWFKRGIKHWWYYFLYKRGIPPQDLYQRYYKHHLIDKRKGPRPHKANTD